MAEPLSPTPTSQPGLRPALNVVGLSHRYGDRQALQSVSFDVAPGESFGLLGPNGGGKSTLLRALLREGLNVDDGYLVYVPQEVDVEDSRRLLDAARALPGDELGRLMTVVRIVPATSKSWVTLR